MGKGEDVSSEKSPEHENSGGPAGLINKGNTESTAVPGRAQTGR